MRARTVIMCLFVPTLAALTLGMATGCSHRHHGVTYRRHNDRFDHENRDHRRHHYSRDRHHYARRSHDSERGRRTDRRH